MNKTLSISLFICLFLLAIVSVSAESYQERVNVCYGITTAMGNSTHYYDENLQNPVKKMNTPVGMVDCKIGECAFFNDTGTRDHLTTANNPNITAASNRTINFWVRMQDKIGVANMKPFVQGVTTQNNRVSWSFRNDEIIVIAGGGTNNFISSVAFHVLNWEMYTLTYDGTVTRLFVNGTFKQGASQILDTTTSAFEIGRSDVDEGFEGYIDEFTIWNANLSESDLLKIYNNGLGTNCTNITGSGAALEDTNPPTNSTWNVTTPDSLVKTQSSTSWNTGGVINITANLLSLTVTASENSNMSCALDLNYNYTTMIATNANYKAATTETTLHSYTVFDNIPVGNHCLYCSFIDTLSNEHKNASSGCLNLTHAHPPIFSPALSSQTASSGLQLNYTAICTANESITSYVSNISSSKLNTTTLNNSPTNGLKFNFQPFFSNIGTYRIGVNCTTEFGTANDSFSLTVSACTGTGVGVSERISEGLIVSLPSEKRCIS